MKKIISISLVLFCFLQSNAQVKAARAKARVAADATPTVITLLPPLYTPFPSNRTDSIWIALDLSKIDTARVPGRPTTAHQPAQKAVKGQKVFVFKGVPANYDDYILFKTAPTSYRLNILEGGKDFTTSGDSIIFKKAITAGSIIDYRPLR